MTKPVFSNTNNWEILDSGEKLASNFGSNGQKIPINPFELPVQAQVPTLAVFVETIDSSIRWRYGGHLIARVFTGLTVGGVSDAIIYRKYLRLNAINLVRIPSLANSYSLSLEVPYWFKSISWIVWEYTGIGEADIEGKLDEIQTLIEY